MATFQGSRVLVVGLGRFGGGVAVSRWLAAQGAHLTITDLANPDTLSESLAQIATLDADLRLGTHDGIDPSKFDLAIINPAVVKRRSELFSRINKASTPWTTEMNLFCQRCPAKLIGVTGSFGKSTTCTMLTTILEAAATAKVISHPNIHLGGNIGRSLLGHLDRILPEDLVVLEMSNAQLEDLPKINRTPDLAVITNMTPHHLDRYDAEDEYFNAKLNIARTQKKPTPIIVGHLHPRAEILLTELIADQPQRRRRIAPPSEPLQLAVPGDHNQIHASAALTIGAQLGINENFARKALRAFHGLPDRLEHVRTIEGATYINDSKSTAPQATIVAIRAIRQTPEYAKSDLVVIVGGKKKDLDLAECARTLRNECRLVICTGESGKDFADAIHELANETDDAPTEVANASTVPDAVTLAKKCARKDDVVLFSPGAPSFDAYVNYVARGEHFRKLVNST